MSRQLKDWLNSYLEFTEETEPPRSYHTWVGISMIAAALKRRCYMMRGHRKVHPNLYVVLIGPSGKCRKGSAMGIGRDMIKDARIQVTSESITREALIRAMRESVESFQNPSTGGIEFHCSLYCMSEELSVFLGQGQITFLSDLTDWYDARDEWKYETKGSGTDDIQGVCFNLLGATASDWLQSILPDEAIGGGFTSRIIFIVEERKGKTIPEEPPPDVSLEKALITDLESISTISGEYKFNEEAHEMYKEWYKEQESRIDSGNPPISDPRFAGYCDRRATHLRKLSMILCASRTENRLVAPYDFERGRKILEAAEINMGRTFGGLGKARFSEATEKVLEVLMQRKEISRSELLRMFYRDMDAFTLEVVEKVLIQMKVVDITIIPDKDEKVYRYVL